MPTQHIGTKYQLTAKDDINAKLTTLTKQAEALVFSKVTTVAPKKTLIICALCEITDHCTDMCSIVTRVKKAHG